MDQIALVNFLLKNRVADMFCVPVCFSLS